MPFAKPKRFKRRPKSRKMPFSQAQVKAVKRIANSQKDLKSKEVASADTSLTNASGFAEDVIGGCAITQGNLDNQREGDQLVLKDVSIKVSLQSGSANGLVRVGKGN